MSINVTEEGKEGGGEVKVVFYHTQVIADTMDTKEYSIKQDPTDSTYQGLGVLKRYPSSFYHSSILAV